MQLPELQIGIDGAAKWVKTSVHVQRLKLSMSGRLTTTALHPRFEALVHGADPNAYKPQFCMGLDQGNNPRIKLGGKQLSPIQDLKNNLKAIVWMLAATNMQMRLSLFRPVRCTLYWEHMHIQLAPAHTMRPVLLPVSLPEGRSFV